MLNEWSIETIQEEGDIETYIDPLLFNPAGSVPVVSTTTRNERTDRLLNRKAKAAEMSLDQAYAAFDMRESYLQRHASPIAKLSD